MAPGRMVVGVDFSVTAARAVREARALATRLGSEVVLVHVREGRPAQPWTPDETARSWLAREGLGVDDLTVRDGTPWLELVRLGRSAGAELLVVGTHGRGGSHPLGLGTTAGRVALSSSRPVLLVGDHGSAGDAGGLRYAEPQGARSSIGAGTPSGSASPTRNTEYP